MPQTGNYDGSGHYAKSMFDFGTWTKITKLQRKPSNVSRFLHRELGRFSLQAVSSSLSATIAGKNYNLSQTLYGPVVAEVSFCG